MRSLKYFLLCIAALAGAPAFAADSIQLDTTKASLIAANTALTPGETLRVGLLLEPKEGWHTYWENPGDSGLAPTLEWSLPAGFTAGAIHWPVPQRLFEGPLATYSYNGKLLLPVDISVPKDIKPGTSYELNVKAEWLICKDICLPEAAELALELPTVAVNAPSSTHALRFQKEFSMAPQKLAKQGSYRITDKELAISIPVADLRTSRFNQAEFFIREPNLILYPAEQKIEVKDGNLILTMPRTLEPPPSTITGILTTNGNDDGRIAYDITFTQDGMPAAMSGGTAPQGFLLPTMLLFAILGGLILNLMPCVLPVLSLKALAIAKKSAGEHRVIVRQGIAYTLGIIASFTLIAVILIALRQTGESVGWGYQMQSPAFVGFLIYLLFLVGLSLSGLFHLPVLLGNIGHLGDESSAKGSFLTGVLATAVATPCTAPFMASAVGVALTLPTWQALLIFWALGLGLALPFLLISLFPSMRRFLPKPGAWMERFKEILAFPMYASVLWLLWVLTLQTGAGGMLIAASSLLLIIFVIWAKSLFADGSRAYVLLALAAYALIAGISLPMLSRQELPTSDMMIEQSAHGIPAVPYSAQKLDELRKAGKPVYVDATAAWCLTCQVNARTALDTDATRAVFKEKGITFMIADWTRRNDDITAFLSSFGYKGVPLNVYYPPNHQEPVVLPQLLTESIVINTIRNVKE